MRVSAAALSAQAHVYVRPQLIPIRTFLTASAPRLLPVRATKAKPKASSVTKTKATPKAKAKPKAKTVASKTKAKRPAKKSVAKAKPKPKPKPKKAKPAKPTRLSILVLLLPYTGLTYMSSPFPHRSVSHLCAMTTKYCGRSRFQSDIRRYHS